MIRLWRIKNSLMRSSRLKTFICQTKNSQRLSAYVTNLTISGLVDFMELQHAIAHLENLRSFTLDSVRFLLIKEKTYAPLVSRKKLNSCIFIGDANSKPDIGPSLYHALSWVHEIGHLTVYNVPAFTPDIRISTPKVRFGDSKVHVKKLTVNGHAVNSSLAYLAETVELLSVVGLDVSSLRVSHHSSFSALIRLHSTRLEQLSITLMAGPLEGLENIGRLSDGVLQRLCAHTAC